VVVVSLKNTSIRFHGTGAGFGSADQREHEQPLSH